MRNAKKPWYENALLITLVGSVIVLVGQLAGTIFPIMYGPYDFSDFYIAADPIAYIIPINKYDLKGDIYSWDSHPILRPYQSEIYLRGFRTTNLS